MNNNRNNITTYKNITTHRCRSSHIDAHTQTHKTGTHTSVREMFTRQGDVRSSGSRNCDPTHGNGPQRNRTAHRLEAISSTPYVGSRVVRKDSAPLLGGGEGTAGDHAVARNMKARGCRKSGGLENDGGLVNKLNLLWVFLHHLK